MKNSLMLCLLTGVTHFMVASVGTAPQAPDVRDAYKRNVAVFTPNSFGSGVIVKTGYVLTNAHVAGDWPLLKIGEKFATRVAGDKEKDLALLKVETVKVSELRFNTKPYLLMEAFYVANPMGHVGLISPGQVVFIDDTHLLTNTIGQRGFSGGGLYDSNGSLLGLNVGMEGQPDIGYTMTVHIPASTIKDFLKGKLP